MLAEERYAKILKLLNEQKTVTVASLVECLSVSESTIRRDLNSLSSMKKIVKVHGGAIVLSNSFDFREQPIAKKEKLFSNEKESIARYAAAAIRPNDFVYIDAGTTTDRMIDFITEKTAAFMTNGFSHAKKLAQKNLKVFIVGGRLKASTDAVIGSECVEALKKYNFTKCFMGTNGISLNAGFTTSDSDEANVKRAAVEQSYVPYILADHSKFNVVSLVTFAAAEKACIITDYLPDNKFREKCIIKETLK